MKATITFILPDETAEHTAAIHGSALAMIIYEFDQWLRSAEKYENRDEIPVEELRAKMRELLGEHGLSFDSVIFT